MNAKEILEKIKAVFAETAPPVPPPPAAPAAMGTDTPYKLLDGTEILIKQAGPMPAVGDVVTVAGAPAAPGDLTLADSTVITVDTTGAITAILPGTPAAVPPVGIDMAKLEQRIAAIEAQVQGNQQPITQMSAAIQKIEAQEATIAKYDKVITGMFELVEKIIDTPSADPKTLTGPKKEKFEGSREKKFEGIAKAMQQLKKEK